MATSAGAPLRLLLLVPLLAGLGAVAWLGRDGPEDPNCVWKSGMDAQSVGAFLNGWAERTHAPALKDWGVSAGPRKLDITLQTAAGECRVRLEVGRSCQSAPHATVLSNGIQGGFPTPPALADLAAGFPAPRWSGSAAHSDATSLWRDVFFGLALALMALGVLARGRGWVVPITLGVLAMVVVAAWPMMDAPFDTDAPALRAAFAATDIFGDWNHPFLPYLLNRPATWVSLEPKVLRVVPLLFLLLEAALLVVATTRAGGLAAGALAGILFACEVPRRHGLIDLGDWDIAGAFLVALLLWTQREQPRRWILLGLLLAAGVFSSWLMIVPAGVLVVLLVGDSFRERVRAGPLVGVVAAFLVLALAAIRIFFAGAQAGPGHASEVAHGMLIESPIGRNAGMAIPLAAGLIWLGLRLRALPERFVLGSLVAVPVAIAIAFRWSHINGGYYAGLVTPFACFAAAAATVSVINATTPHRLVAAAALLALVGLTVSRMLPPVPRGWEYSGRFSQEIAQDQLPILTNSNSLGRALAFERARGSGAPIHDVVMLPPELASRMVMVAHGSCLPEQEQEKAAGPFYLVIFGNNDPASRDDCLHQYGARCQELAPPSADRSIWFYRCGPRP